MPRGQHARACVCANARSLQLQAQREQQKQAERHCAQRQQPTSEKPLQTAVEGHGTGFPPADVRRVDHVAQGMQPYRIGLCQLRVVAQRGVVLHVAVKLCRPALLQQPGRCALVAVFC